MLDKKRILFVFRLSVTALKGFYLFIFVLFLFSLFLFSLFLFSLSLSLNVFLCICFLYLSDLKKRKTYQSLPNRELKKTLEEMEGKDKIISSLKSQLGDAHGGRKGGERGGEREREVIERLREKIQAEEWQVSLLGRQLREERIGFDSQVFDFFICFLFVFCFCFLFLFFCCFCCFCFCCFLFFLFLFFCFFYFYFCF